MTIYQPKPMSRVCYTYILTFTHPHTGCIQKYYGSRTAQGCHPNDFFNPYTTSSIDVNALIVEYGKQAFTFEIHDTFGEDAWSCLHYETQMIKWLKAVKSPDWLNRHDNSDAWSMTDKHHTEETKKIMSESRVGIPKSMSMRRRLSETRTGMPRPDLKVNMKGNGYGNKPYDLIDPDGNRHTGSGIVSLCKAIEKPKYRFGLSALAQGKISEFNGWRAFNALLPIA